jgi:hypothetical protein
VRFRIHLLEDFKRQAKGIHAPKLPSMLAQETRCSLGRYGCGPFLRSRLANGFLDFLLTLFPFLGRSGKVKLEEHPRAKARLEELLYLNQNLNTAYVLKEDLREFWNCSSREEAEEHLNNWLAQAESSGIDLLVGFAAKLASHCYGLLNYFDHPITTAQVEGTNNKIKVLKRQAYGFRDMHYFKLRIYNLHESRYALVG